jgi:hypothetical protein
MKHQKPASRRAERISQPEPFTPGFTKTMVREHAFALYRDKLNHEGTLTLEDWVLAEKDLVKDLQTAEIPE